MVVGLSLNDDPVGYTPPIGPNMRFKFWYSQRDQQQPATFTFTNFGPRWTTKASILHWMHAPAPYDSSTSHVIESTKEPLENRVWYKYAGFPYPNTLGPNTINRPIIVTQIQPDGATAAMYTFSYNNIGKPLTITDPVNRQLTLTYDPANNFDLLTVTNTTLGANDLLASYHYTNHVVDSFTGANGATTTYLPNAAGQNTLTTYPAPQGPVQYVYDAVGGGYVKQVEVLSSAVGGAFTTVSSFTYDGFGRVNTVTDAAGYTTTYLYDAADRLTDQVFRDGTRNTFGYTLLDVTSITDRNGKTTSLGFDADRRLRQATVGNRTVSIGYDTRDVQFGGTDSR